MITIYHPGLPPSSNNAYINLPRGGRRLSKEGEKYKNETLAYLTRNYRKELLTFRKDIPYCLLLTFYFERIENEGWATGTAKTRYKKFDATNRPKLLEDVLKDATGADDSQNLDVYLRKRSMKDCMLHGPGVTGPSVEHVDIHIWDLEKEANPFDAVLGSFR